ncbi:ARID/BRIGHT DNA-binding domain [Striga asiatica]|uniref:ARID/BRIGHT DNA-binding domain n=1 Tax=Striga asiatica TaxID=4170 RepID=A0A5A7RF72_STRAF|nr:ARID/BRIGHT DNA-binding domain [Striga asiatica]
MKRQSGEKEKKRQSGEKEKKSVDTAHISGIGDVQRNSMFGKYSEVEIVSKLKALAVDPDNPQFARDNIQAFRNQIVKLRKVMVLKDSEIPWRKRKLEQFVKDKLRPPSPFGSPNKENNTRKTSRKQSSHVSPTSSCLLNSSNSTRCLHEKTTFDPHASTSLLTFEYSLLDDALDFNCLCSNNNTPPNVDSDDSVKGPNPNHLSPIESFPNGSARRKPSRQSKWLLNIVSDHFQKKVVPVGPRFQADVPKWAGPAEKPNDDSKWLGTRVWPTQTRGNNNKGAGKAIGKGRPDSCSCVSRGSSDCVRRHVLDEKRALQRDLGLAFFIWKFDEMGERVSESWSLKEKNRYESLLKTRQNSNDGKSFLKRALKCFPNKTGKDIVNYYFNVYIPNRMRSESTRQVDTDDDEDEDFNYLGVKKKSPVKKSKSKDVKVRAFLILVYVALSLEIHNPWIFTVLYVVPVYDENA